MLNESSRVRLDFIGGVFSAVGRMHLYSSPWVVHVPSLKLLSLI